MAILAITIAVIVGAGVAHWRAERALQTRFLTIDPDIVVNDAELLHYANSKGKDAYDAHCATCHGANLEGDGKRGVPSLVDKDWLYGSGRTGEIERIVRYGIRSGHSRTQNLASMPAFARPDPYPRHKIEPLTRGDIEDVAAMIYSFQHPNAVDPATRARGEAIYHGRGFCFDCHSGDARGDPSIGAPNLTDDIWLYGDGSLPSIRFTIENGASGYCPAFAARLPAAIIRSIAVYVHTASVT